MTILDVEPLVPAGGTDKPGIETEPGAARSWRARWRPSPSRTPSTTAFAVRTALLALATVCLGLVLYIFVIGAIEHSIRQNSLYSTLRATLYAGTAPTGPLDAKGNLIKGGTPVALLRAPTIGLDEVVGEGTTSEILMGGPGHLRSTPLPGQPGVSVIVGRQAAFGGPFRNISHLKRGATIQVTVAFGTNQEIFKVVDVRHAGSAIPALSSGSRLILVTASGSPLLPGGLVYVDADLVGPTQPASQSIGETNPADRPGQGDPSTLWALALWLQALLLAVGSATWSWYRWGRVQTAIVFTPVIFLVGFFVSDQVARVLPNVM